MQCTRVDDERQIDRRRMQCSAPIGVLYAAAAARTPDECLQPPAGSDQMSIRGRACSGRPSSVHPRRFPSCPGDPTRTPSGRGQTARPWPRRSWSSHGLVRPQGFRGHMESERSASDPYFVGCIALLGSETQSTGPFVSFLSLRFGQTLELEPPFVSVSWMDILADLTMMWNLSKPCGEPMISTRSTVLLATNHYCLNKSQQ